MAVSMVRHLPFAGVVAVMALLSVSPTLAEPVQVRAAVHDGYGRIVFNWPTPVVYNATSVGGHVVVNFGRPIETSYAVVVRALRSYIRDATPGPDGRSVTFALRGKYTIRSFDMGAAVVVDLVKPPKTIQIPTAATAPEVTAANPPATTTAAPNAGPSIGVRTGIHKGYTRIVFDWPKKVDYSVARDGGKTVVTFDRPARIDLQPLLVRPLKFIDGASLENAQDGAVVVLLVPETSRVRNFRSGPKVVIDVMAPSPDQLSKIAKPEQTPTLIDNKLAPVEPSTSPEKTPQQVGKPVPLRPDKPQALRPGKPQALSPPGKAAEKAGAPDSPNVRDSTGVLDKKDEAALALLTGVKIIGPAVGPVGQADQAASGVGQQTGGDTVSIRINWDEPVASAVFRRVGYLWVVFDKPAHMDIGGLRAAAGNIVRSIEQIPDDRATFLRLTTLSGVNPSLKRDGLAWILEFKQQPLQPTSAIEINPQPHSPIGARLFLPVTEPGDGLALTDPAVGDNLIVVPVIPLGYGVAVAREYPQVRILASSQGIVMKPKSDDLRVRSLRQGVEVTSGSGLKLSDVPAALAAESKLDGATTMRTFSRLFDLNKWKQVDVETFNATKQDLERVAANAKISEREQARMNLARYYFANGYGPEALGVLRNVARDNPKILETAEYRGISGAINTLMRRFDDAHADLDNSAVDNNDEGVFWRAALRAYEGDLIGAAPNLRRMGGIIRAYPKPLKIPLGMLIAEAAIELGDTKQAVRYLETMRANDPSPAQSSEMDYIEGRLLELSGDFDGAIGKWEKVQEGPHRPSQAKAAIARTELLLKLGQIDSFEAIKELEKLRFAWRGDKLEFNLLRRLGELYLEIGDYRNGLRTLRQAATHFRDYEKAPEVTKEMTDAFTRLYLDNAADSLQPITAISLYDEFKELTPPGDQGDKMIRNLADRLVKVDLLDRAAGLLKAQVDFRLKGLEKARIGARLALVHILALEYDSAVEDLQQSDVKDLPEELVTQRRHLMARALMGLQQTDDALVLLKDDQSHDAELLRTEIFWNDKEWGKAAKSLRSLIKLSGAKPNEPVDQTQGQYLLNLAVAMTLNGDEQGIARLRNDYGPAMDETTFRDAFRLIASTQNQGLIKYASIANRVAIATNFESYIAAYQERLKERKLSAIN